MPITKSDLIEHLSTQANLPRGTAEQVVNAVFDTMVAALVREDRIEIRGFGSFEVRSYKPYQGRNPRTGETVSVAAKKLPFFKVGKDLRERINAGCAEPPSGDESAGPGPAGGTPAPGDSAAGEPSSGDSPDDTSMAGSSAGDGADSEHSQFGS